MKLHLGDCLQILKSFAQNSIDSIVTDPPYGLKFMGKKWDYDVPSVDIWKECLRVLKPGAHMLVACGTRTQHRMAVNIEEAGFEIRDVITWLYGSGFPKSHDVSKAIDKAAGAEREIGPTVGELNGRVISNHKKQHEILAKVNGWDKATSSPSTDLAKKWQGFGTALKPACEFWTLVRKPLEGTVAKNVEKYGTGGINIDGTRIYASNDKDAYNIDHTSPSHKSDETFCILNKLLDVFGCETCVEFHPSNVQVCVENLCKALGFQSDCLVYRHLSDELLHFFLKAAEGASSSLRDVRACIDRLRKEQSDSLSSLSIDRLSSLDASLVSASQQYTTQILNPQGRFPANLILDEEAGEMLDEQVSLTMKMHSAGVARENDRDLSTEKKGMFPANGKGGHRLGDSGGASRFFYCAKASKSERGIDNNHPTVKPIKLMQYLCRLITPPGGVVLDPFMGSGSTGCAAKLEGFQFVGIEMNEEYMQIAEKRIAS